MNQDDNIVRFELDPKTKKSLYAAFKEMDKGANQALKADVLSISQWMANKIIEAANTAPKSAQAQAVAASVRARKDRMPYISVGGAQKRTKHGTPVGVILHGSEFGSDRYRQFPWSSGKSPTGRGSKGYWIYPTLRRYQAQLTHDWKRAIEKHVINPWGQDG